jgi:hypothetical protein
MKAITPPDAVALLKGLTSSELERHLGDLIAQEKAVVALLKSVRARERVEKIRSDKQREVSRG